MILSMSTASTQENVGRTSRLAQGKLAQRTPTSRATLFRDVSNAEEVKHAKLNQKLKQGEDSSNYFVSHDKPECDPNKSSVFTSKFVPSASFNNLVASIKNTRLSQRQYVMANVTSKVSLDCMKVDEEPTPVKDYSNPGPLKLPEVPDWDDLDLPDLDDFNLHDP